MLEKKNLNVSEDNELRTLNKQIMGIYKKEGVRFPHDR
jgi:hypothetical protein